jgi:hypothetical protein
VNHDGRENGSKGRKNAEIGWKGDEGMVSRCTGKQNEERSMKGKRRKTC